MEIEEQEDTLETKPKVENSYNNLRSAVVLSLKNSMPKPCSGTKIANRIRKMGLSLADFAFLVNRSVGGLKNACAPNNARYKKGKEGENIELEIVVTFLEKLYEERKQKAKEEKAAEKERVFGLITGKETISTTLSLRECNTVENKKRVMSAISVLSQNGIKKISYTKIAEMTGLTPQQVANIREKDQDIDDWFSASNEVEFDEMQNNLSEIAENNKEDKPSIAIKAMETKMKYMKSKQKDKISADESEENNIWNKFRAMRDVTAPKNEILVIDSEAEEKN